MNIKSYLSIETCLRWLKKETTRTSFLTFQIPLEKIKFNSGTMTAIVKDEKIVIWQQLFEILKDKIVFLESHEDPLLQNKNFAYVNIHLPETILKHLPQWLDISISQGENIIYQNIWTDLPFDRLFHTLNSRIDNSFVISDKDCNLTLHLGNTWGHYHEETFILKANTPFNFNFYIKPYTYIGVQCSYEDEHPEIEEKHILKGQKGIRETADFIDKDGRIYYSSIGFNSTYLNQYDTTYCKFKKVENLDDLISFIKKITPMKNIDTVPVFEMDYHFLLEHYKNNSTYSQSNFYSSKPLKKKIQLDNQVCNICPYKSACLQTVPSGLAYDLFKENISLDESEAHKCRIYQLIKNAA